MLSNPLCLAIQVLALLLGECPTVCTIFPGLARYDDVTSSGWPNEGWFSSPVDDRCWIEETTPPFHHSVHVESSPSDVGSRDHFGAFKSTDRLIPRQWACQQQKRQHSQ
ncbi:hypothetical protein MRX96_055111 [Rhipicephalus microplus]